MNTEIRFPELVKMIHPDLNPNIPDVGRKMSEAVRYKNNPVELFRLAVQWGLIQGKKAKKLFFFHIGNVVEFNRRRAIIIDVESYRDRIGHVVYMADIVKRVILKAYVRNTETSKCQNINVIGKSSSKDFVIADALYKTYKYKMVLRPNTDYSNVTFKVWARTLKRIITVTRTSAKSVYYFDNRTGKERYVLMKNVRVI